MFCLSACVSPLYHIELREEKVQLVIKVIDLLNLLVRDVPVNQLLRLFSGLNLEMLTESINVIPVLLAACKQF